MVAGGGWWAVGVFLTNTRLYKILQMPDPI